MKTYILAVCGSVVISALAGVLVSESRLGKFIYGFLKLMCVTVAIFPLPNLIQNVVGGVWWEEVGSDSDLVPDTDYLNEVFEKRSEIQEKDLEKLIYSEFGAEVTSEIIWNRVEYSYVIQKINIKVEKFGINEENSHIFVIEQIQKRVLQMFADTEVSVYE